MVHKGTKGRDLSLGFKASEKSEGTLPVQCDHDRAIPTVYTTLFGREEREIAVFGIYLEGVLKPPTVDCLVVTAVVNYALFIWGIGAVHQEPSDRRFTDRARAACVHSDRWS